jgi:Uma2 family endonuclease
MGMPVPVQPYYTVDDVLAFPDDGNRYELAYGKLLVSPSPRMRHQILLGRLFRAVDRYCEEHGVGMTMMSPADLTWGRDDILTQPDVFVVGANDVHLRVWSELRHIPLVAEVLSPSTKGHDRFDKRRVYQDVRVGLYWIVDGEENQVEVWTPDAHFPVIERERLQWHPAGAAQPLTIELADLLAE